MHGVRTYWNHLLGPGSVHLFGPLFLGFPFIFNKKEGGVQHFFGHCAPKGARAFIQGPVIGDVFPGHIIFHIFGVQRPAHRS